MIRAIFVTIALFSNTSFAALGGHYIGEGHYSRYVPQNQYLNYFCPEIDMDVIIKSSVISVTASPTCLDTDQPVMSFAVQLSRQGDRLLYDGKVVGTITASRLKAKFSTSRHTTLWVQLQELNSKKTRVSFEYSDSNQTDFLSSSSMMH